MYKRILTISSFLLATQLPAFSQVPIPSIPGLSIGNTDNTDTARKPAPPPPDARNQIKPYSELITAGYTTSRGMFTIHQKKDSFYFELPASLLNRDIMVINRLVKGPGGTGVYSGEELGQQTIRFTRSAIDSAIRLSYVSVMGSADSSQQIAKAVRNSYSDPVAFVFPIKAIHPDSGSFVIDATQYIRTTGNLFNDIAHQALSGAIDLRSLKDILVESVRTFPINVEMVTSKNGLTKPSPVMSSGGSSSSMANPQPTTVVVNTSFILLPEKPMQQRYMDPRVGYFADYELRFADQQQKMEQRKFIHRWRLEPRPEDMKKWKKGELVEPQQPIVIYIDPATPKQWRKHLIAGINDWQQAFEQAGFKNAIIGKEWPENDPAMQLDDARFSVIRYLPSEQMNAYGPNIHDPRSGEIIQTQIGWYHNVMNLLRNWYFIQAAPNDPQARKPIFDDALMGNLIRFVSSHEVGHTLGLRHNFGSSSCTPVDSLRSRSYLARHRHTASIMDYARFNYVAQPEDNIPQHLLFPGIGDYDRWAIEWGYKHTTASFEEDKKAMGQLIVSRTAGNPRLWFGDGESKRFDPRCQTEDLGDNPMKANSYGIKNLQRIMANLPEWTEEPGGTYTTMEELYKEVQGQFTRYITHVSRFIGGARQTLHSEQQTGDIFEPVSQALQEEALRFFDEQLFTTPSWLLNPKVTSKVGIPAYPDFVEDLQAKAINSLMDIVTINKLLVNQQLYGSKAYPLAEYISALHGLIWKELPTGNITSVYRRNLQKNYIGNLQQVLLDNQPENTENDAYSLMRQEMVLLQEELTAALGKSTDKMSRYHLSDLIARIKKTLDEKK
ncbi:MAG: zinc-dependent metalloprotease [Candidatus Pseudobacter hemicellulosilyticus]|uniref:Zinc-dependent metalloprotease n=1 Tax=Candidatus Pseudobacter hemicellulosilyticus TaxID=3121375 RepID=A0AAJ6BGL3_9BACT|nr:MAG: zinc-dependent metalloprotease [Pseudobacter sp.]